MIKLNTAYNGNVVMKSLGSPTVHGSSPGFFSSLFSKCLKTIHERPARAAYCFVSMYSTVVQRNYTVIMNTFQWHKPYYRFPSLFGVRCTFLPEISGEERVLPSLTAAGNRACKNPGKVMNVFCFFSVSKV